jgi:hypothetical protein
MTIAEREPVRLPEVDFPIQPGVAPETYSLVIFILNNEETRKKIDELNGAKANVNTTNLIFTYFGENVQLKDLGQRHGGRVNNSKRIIRGLTIAWEDYTAENNPDYPIYPMQQAVRLKDSAYSSSTKGTHRSSETARRISGSVEQTYWKKYGIDAKDQEAKQSIVAQEWFIITHLLRRVPSYKDINMLRKKQIARFSTAMYKSLFGDGSFTIARKYLEELTSKKDIYEDGNSSKKMILISL